MGLIFNGNGDVIKAVDGSLTVEGLDLGGGTNINAGIATFSGNVNVGGVLTYEDVKNVDSVGIISARQSIHVGYGVSAAGIITATSYRGDGSQLTGITIPGGNTGLDFNDSVKARFGTGNDFEIYFNGSDSYLRNEGGGDFVIVNSTSGTIEMDPGGGKVQIKNDLEISDKIIHTGDTNTAIRFPAADTFSVETAGQQNVQVNGTRVLLKSPSGTDTTVRLQHQGNSGYGDIILDRTVNAFIIDNDPGNAGSNGTYFSVKTIGSEKLRINSAGTVRIKRAVSSSMGNDSIFLALGDTENGANVNRMIGFGYNSNFGTSVYPASIGYTESDNSGNTRGHLIFATRNTTGATDVPTERLRIQTSGKTSFSYDATPANAQYGQIEISKNGASNADPDWSYLSFHRVGQIAWQQGIDSNAFVIAKTGGGSKDTLDTERLRITSAGNIGQSVTPSGWSTAQANDFFAYQIGSGMAMFGRGSGDLDRGGISVNYFHTASATKYIGNGNANRIYMEDGSIVFSSAAANSSGADAAMTLNERMKIDVNGKILLGTTRTQYANDYYDDITINNSGGSGAAGGTGITMISNSASWGALQFGDQDDDDAAYIKYDHNGNKFIFGIEDGSVRFWQTKAKTWFGTTGHGDGSRSTLFDLVGENQDPIGAWGQMGIYSSTAQAQDRGGSITFGGQDGTTARQYFAGIQGAKENGTGGNYAGNLNFFTRPSGAVPVRRLRIESWGTLTAWEGPSQHNGNPGRLASGHIMTWNSTHVSGGLAVGWYPIIHLTDGCYLFMLKTGAHSSILFTASNGYDPSNVSYINVLHYTNNRNSSYLNVDGLRATSDGIIEVHLTASSSDYFEMQAQILGPEKIGSSSGFYSTLTKNTGSPTVNDTKYPLTYSAGAMQLENVRIDGTLSKNAGSFRIPHPLPALNDTKDLSHSFIEGPQCDNIYRGKIDLVGGTATVNLDTKSNMTEGTFVVLNRDVQCYTTNETGWTNVKGSVSGNILTITAQDSNCTDTISWMVVGERQDDSIKSEKCALTDDNGSLIVEQDRFTNRGQSPDDSKPNLT